MQVTNLPFKIAGLPIAGLPINEYRINDGNPQVRALDPDARTILMAAVPAGRGWCRGTLRYFQGPTVVGKWLEDRVCEWDDAQELTRAAQRDERESTPITAK